MPETYAYFYVDGFVCEPDTISAHLDLKPSIYWCAGDPHLKRPNQFFDRSGWRVESESPRNIYDMSVPAAELVDLLISRFDRFMSLPSHKSKGINCVGYYFSENSSFHMTPDLAAKIAKLNIAVDFDLYNMRESDELWFWRVPDQKPNQRNNPCT